MRLLLALLDTEGGVKRDGVRTPLREVCLQVMGAGVMHPAEPFRGRDRLALDGELWRHPHTMLWTGGDDDAGFQRHFVTSVRRLVVKEQADGLAIVAWNAKHDRAVLEACAEWDPLEIRWACALEWTRGAWPGRQSYSLRNVMRDLGVQRQQLHTAYTDVLDTEEVLKGVWEQRGPWDARRWVKELRWLEPKARSPPLTAASLVVPPPFKASAYDIVEWDGLTYAAREGWHASGPDFNKYGLLLLKNGGWQRVSKDKKLEVMRAAAKVLFPDESVSFSERRGDRAGGKKGARARECGHAEKSPEP